MQQEIIEIANYTKKTGGRSDCEFSGDWFLDEILWPKIQDNWLNKHCKIKINFNNVEYKPGFIDQVFSKLVSKYKFIESKDCFIFICDDKNLILDILAAIVGAEYKIFNKIYTNIWK